MTIAESPQWSFEDSEPFRIFSESIEMPLGEVYFFLDSGNIANTDTDAIIIPGYALDHPLISPLLHSPLKNSDTIVNYKKEELFKETQQYNFGVFLIRRDRTNHKSYTMFVPLFEYLGYPTNESEVTEISIISALIEARFYGAKSVSIAPFSTAVSDYNLQRDIQATLDGIKNFFDHIEDTQIGEIHFVIPEILTQEEIAILREIVIRYR